MIDPRISPVITSEARRVEPSAPVREAAQFLRDPDVPALVVTGESGEPLGIVTESDLVALLAETEDRSTVARAASSPVTTIRRSATVSEAAARMREAGVRVLPVVDHRDGCDGLVTAEGLAPYLSRTSLDVEWDEEPLRLDADAPSGVPAHE